MQVSTTRAVLLGMAFALMGAADLAAADWPMWRYDAARSAASPHPLPTNLTLLWSRKLPPVQPAWPLEPEQRLNFDASYEPVVLGKLLFLASPNDGSVTAYETETGAERWKFFTQGPVRCAPACWSNRVYVGSDDGWLYCLEAETGREVWKVRGAPAERPERWQIGNGHLVSFWPVRGGPVVAEGVVYFAAGIWPIFGVFVHAVDAQTGRVKWSNDKLHYLTNVRCEHTDLWETGLSPQGYLALSGRRLVVACGRAMPAGLDADTGELINYDRGWRRGDSRVAVHGEYIFVGRSGLLRLQDFYEFGSRFPMAAALQEYKLIRGCDAYSAFDGGIAYGQEQGQLHAHDVTRVNVYERECPIWDTKVRALTFEPALVWQQRLAETGTPRGVVIKAGGSLITGVGRKIVAVDAARTPPCVVWETQLVETPASLIAGDGKLFVATVPGGLYCFGSGVTPVSAAATSGETAGPVQSGGTEGDAGARQAAEIVAVSGVSTGYCLVLGLTDGALVQGLIRQTALRVIAVDGDAAKIDALRRNLAARGLLGLRVELFVGPPAGFLCPPYLASLMVSECPAEAGLLDADVPARLFEVLRPYGGALVLQLPADHREVFVREWRKTGQTNAVVRQQGEWSLLVREGPLAGAAAWSHVGADAANTFCSRDERVRGPLGFLWYGDIVGHPGAGSAFEVAGGRVFTLRQHSRSAGLFAYDAYTGLPLWQASISNATRRADMAAMDDGLYVALSGGRGVVCDPANGAVQRTFAFGTNGAAVTKGIRVDGELILVAATDVDNSALQDLWADSFWDFTTLICVERQTGRERWRRTARGRFNTRALAVGAGMVFCAESLPVAELPKAVGTNAVPREVESTVLALEGMSGAVKWQRTFRYDSTRRWTPEELSRGGAGSHVIRAGYADDWLAYAPEARVVVCGRFLQGNGMEAATGCVLWEGGEVRGAAPLIVRGRSLVTSNGDIHDVVTGARTGQYPEFVHRSGCNYALGSAHLFLQRDSSAFYYDFTLGEGRHLRNIRSGCFNNLIAADGLLNVPSTAGCRCNLAGETSYALVHMPEVAEWSGARPLVLNPRPMRAKQP